MSSAASGGRSLRAAALETALTEKKGGDAIMDPIHLTCGYLPGLIGRVTELHGVYYHHHWGFGPFFEAKVAADLSGFINRYDHTRDAIWSAARSGRIEGAIAIDGRHAGTDGAHLRWFILSDHLRGKGIGRRLMDAAMGFCREKGYARICLWTFQGLHAARHLYEAYGFRLVEQREGDGWGVTVNEQRFIREPID
jgi:GNAT superfamily N-acetyltransferase